MGYKASSKPCLLCGAWLLAKALLLVCSARGAIAGCAVLFPEGVAVVPYLTPGTVEIGEATAQKMQKFRVVMWLHHGVFVSHIDLESGFGLLEAVEKSAEIVLKIKSAGGALTPMSISEIQQLGEQFGAYLNPELLWE